MKTNFIVTLAFVILCFAFIQPRAEAGQLPTHLKITTAHFIDIPEEGIQKLSLWSGDGYRIDINLKVYGCVEVLSYQGIILSSKSHLRAECNRVGTPFFAGSVGTVYPVTLDQDGQILSVGREHKNDKE